MNDDVNDWAKYDFWTQPDSAPPSPSQHLSVQTLNDIEPLDNQFGAQTRLTVPDALYDLIFGQPAPPPSAETPPHGTPPQGSLHSYAILDAAKITNLPDLLEASGLEHRCLFKGAAYDDLKDVAPWIVRLEQNNTFTRNLFTRTDAPWHLWDADPGIYLRSPRTLDDLWTHFRKFTKVQGENGAWLYFRFWEGSFIATAITYSNTLARNLFGDVFAEGVMFRFKNGFLNISGEKKPHGKPETDAAHVQFSEIEIRNVYALRHHEDYMSVVKEIPKTHWIFPFISEVLLENLSSSGQLRKMATIPEGTVMQKMLLSLLNNQNMAQTGRVQALRYITEAV